MKELGIKQNFLGIEKKYSNYKDSQIIVLSAPLEKTVSYGKGTSKGPEEILKASHYVEFYDEEQKRELCFEKGICTLKPMNLQKLSIEKSLQKIHKEVAKHIDEGKFVVTLGGEHSLSVAPIMAFNERFPNLSILQIDAHSDLRDSYEGSKYSHASVMARVAEFNSNIVQVGIRAQCIDEVELKQKKGIKTFYAREIKMGMYGENWHELIVNNLTENVYITFDVDGLDPSLLPATGTPEPGGLLWDETMNLLKSVGTEKNIVGFDVVELAPTKYHPSSNFVAAKLVYKMMNYAFIDK
ncbi:MAG: agmatinase [Melioribacter sp.]|uniref:agmatinase n=1 Tax=Rosettibacter primus TaxID=3111523 RepID=UPI00247D3276|nr:agmatinase [Melioribacter sp.]